jgi:hypothetical protein
LVAIHCAGQPAHESKPHLDRRTPEAARFGRIRANRGCGKLAYPPSATVVNALYG